MIAAITLSPRDYDAVLFDLDGVLTRTASVHAAAWKKLFDGVLEQRATKAGAPFVPFDIENDYPRYVDGKPRYDGVADFLESRGIALPLGAPEDGPDIQSVHALGSLKDRYFLAQLKQQGVEPYAPAIALVRKLRAREIKTAVVSSSRTARWCSRLRVSRTCSTRAWTGRTSRGSGSRVNPRRMLFWRRHGASEQSPRAPPSWKTRSRAWRLGAPAASAV